MSLINWNLENATKLYEKSFMDLVYEAQTIHRQHFDPQKIQLSTLINIKQAGCPEDCGYCSQSAHYQKTVGLERQKLMDVDTILTQAHAAKENGTSRFCMGAAWRSPPKKEFEKVLTAISAVKKMGLETCVTLGMLDAEQACALKEAGLDYYNHNLDTSPEFYSNVTTTRTYQDRLDTLRHVHEAGIKVCCGGIMGLGESRQDRISFLITLANLSPPPDSVPINRLIPIPGTPLENAKPIDNIEFVRTVAAARIMMPKSFVRLSAGRNEMSEEMQALCFMAGANSIHYDEALLTTKNPSIEQDQRLFEKLDLIATAAA